MMSKYIRRNRILIPSLLLVLIATLMPGDGKIAGNYLDKVAHFLLFAFLTINILYKYENSFKLIDYLLFCVLLGFATEFAQQFIPGRGLDFYDAVADTLGIVVAFFVYKKARFGIGTVLRVAGA